MNHTSRVCLADDRPLLREANDLLAFAQRKGRGERHRADSPQEHEEGQNYLRRRRQITRDSGGETTCCEGGDALEQHDVQREARDVEERECPDSHDGGTQERRGNGQPD